jgi:proteasome accessory factor A
VRRRIFGLETEYGISFTHDGRRRLSPDEIARHLFRHVVSWGRSSNVFLENGARLYLDVGSHPEYATPECDSPLEAVVHERAGDRLVLDLAQQTSDTLTAEGVEGRIRIFRNNTDSAGNSYGSHENYLFERRGDFQQQAEALIPFLVTRQLFAGAGKVLQTARGPVYVLSQRAEHMWEGLSSATTRSRPIINTRDEPHADAERFRRLHVIVGDSNMSEYTTWLRLATCDLVIRLLEELGGVPPIALDNPTRAIREVSHDLTGGAAVQLTSGRSMTAMEIQVAYLDAVERFVADQHADDVAAKHVIGEWRFVLETIADDPMRLSRQLDWVAKLTMIESYRARHGLTLGDPRVAMLDLSYHDIDPAAGLHHLLVRQGRMQRLSDDREVDRAMSEPPATTRAALRGRFIREAKARGKDFTVDWVHLKLNEQVQRTVLCKDPLVWEDERVDRLIASM